MKCYICNSKTEVEQYYNVCNNCGHSYNKSLSNDLLVNDDLTIKNIRKLDSLLLFKLRTILDVVKNFSPYPNFLDLGSASGKLIYHLKKKQIFKNTYGLEVNKESVLFSRTELNLNIFQNKIKQNIAFGLVTAWHSFEHVKLKQLEVYLSDIKKSSKKTNIFLLVSVPNNSSFVAKYFPFRNPFFDKNNHVSQFTEKSLNIFLKKNNFKVVKKYYSYPYNFFCYIQLSMNIINFGGHNFFYHFLKRKDRSEILIFILNLAIIILFLPIIGFLILIDVLGIIKSPVYTCLYELGEK